MQKETISRPCLDLLPLYYWKTSSRDALKTKLSLIEIIVSTISVEHPNGKVLDIENNYAPCALFYNDLIYCSLIVVYSLILAVDKLLEQTNVGRDYQEVQNNLAGIVSQVDGAGFQGMAVSYSGSNVDLTEAQVGHGLINGRTGNWIYT